MAAKYVYAKMTRTGLCNKLFPWARAALYAKETGALMIAPKWTDLMRVGPWIRREKYKRYYFNEFVNKRYASRLWGLRTNHVAEKVLGVRVFTGIKDLFGPFLHEQAFINQELRRITNPVLLAAAESIGKVPFIGVHIRRGDFVTIKKALPDEWYLSAIKKAYDVVGEMPVKIFSDASADSLAGIAGKIKDAVIMPVAPAMQDIFTLACAKAMVCTADSTFSMWPVFLGQMASFWPKDAVIPRLYVNGTAPILV